MHCRTLAAGVAILAALVPAAPATAAPSAAHAAAPAAPASDTSTPEAPRAGEVTTSADLLAWAEAHPRRAAVVVLSGDDPDPAIASSADRPMPLASTRKVLVLLAATRMVSAGRLDLDAPVPLADVERWYVPGTDGGAHPAAVADLGEEWTVRTALDAMITYSDNAAADWLLDEVGGPAAVDALARDLGLSGQDPTWSFLGEYLAWARQPDRWLAASPAQRQRIAGRLAARTTGPVTLGPIDLTRQRSLALASVRGTARDLAGLMRRVDRSADAGDEAYVLARDVLSWPRQDPDVAAAFPTFATKGGAFVGVLTEVTAIRARGREPVYVAQLYRALPPALEQHLRQTFLQQTLYVDLALGRLPLRP